MEAKSRFFSLRFFCEGESFPTMRRQVKIRCRLFASDLPFFGARPETFRRFSGPFVRHKKAENRIRTFFILKLKRSASPRLAFRFSRYSPSKTLEQPTIRGVESQFPRQFLRDRGNKGNESRPPSYYSGIPGFFGGTQSLFSAEEGIETHLWAWLPKRSVGFPCPAKQLTAHNPR